jgi:UDP-N-acetylmuramoylalanine--D-glutamate ligase
MVNKALNKIIKGKKILILGFGKEGQSTYITLRKYFPEQDYTISDTDISVKNNELIKDDKHLKFVLGEHYLDCLNDFDLIIKSPGISLKNLIHPISLNKITSQSDIFINLFYSQIIGITGTKGKSTTSCLIYHIIHLFTDNSVLVGNIGIPPFEKISYINKDTKIVYELSSHQLEYISSSPHISVLLNLFHEHLDYYKSFNDYQLAKFNITKYQNKNDYLIYNADDKLIEKQINKFGFKKKYFKYSLKNKVKQGCYIDKNSIKFCFNDKKEKNIYDLGEKRFLKGEHNIMNIMAAINVCKITGIPDHIIIKGVSNFKGLEHRIEYVGKYNNIYFYNDSIATIPEATTEAIKTLKKVDTIILGGYDRGIDYTDLIKFISKSSVRNLIFIDKAGKRMLNELGQYKNKNQRYFYVYNLEDAVKTAKKNTKENFICLLSPAAASYGMFKNFEQRGKIYKKLVKIV